MQPNESGNIEPAWMRRTGVALSTVAILFLLFDSSGKLFKVAPVVTGTTSLGYPESIIRTLGVILLLCVTLYAIPRASILGALLLTGYLGGAVASHARIGSPLLTHVIFPVYVACFVWGGLLLRDARLRHLLPVAWPSRDDRREERCGS